MRERTVGWLLAGAVAVVVALGVSYWVVADPGPTSPRSVAVEQPPSEQPPQDQVVIVDPMPRVDMALPVMAGNLLRETAALPPGQRQGFRVPTERDQRYLLEIVCALAGPGPGDLELTYNPSTQGPQEVSVACDGEVNTYAMEPGQGADLFIEAHGNQTPAYAIRVRPQ